MALRAEALISRYPDISERELASLIHTFPYLPILDIGLMTADDRLAPKLDAFHRDHGHKFQAPVSSLMLFLAVPAMLAMGALWLILA